MVEQVERLRTELQRGPFLDGRGLGDREIDIFESRRREDVAAGVTEARRLPHERRRIQKARGRRIRQVQRHAGHQEWTVERLQTSLAVGDRNNLSLIHISEPTRQAEISYAVFCLKK